MNLIASTNSYIRSFTINNISNLITYNNIKSLVVDNYGRINNIISGSPIANTTVTFSLILHGFNYLNPSSRNYFNAV